MSSLVKVTAALIDSYKTKHGGWTKADLALLGVAWPPVKGWRKRLIREGKLIRIRN